MAAKAARDITSYRHTGHTTGHQRRPEWEPRPHNPEDGPIAGYYAGVPYTREALKGTIWLLRYFKRFLASDFKEAKDPEDRIWKINTITKPQAQARLWFLIEAAINRRARISDCPGRKHDSDYQRNLYHDRIMLDDWLQRRIRPGMLRFRTPEVQRRLGHLLPDQEDYR